MTVLEAQEMLAREDLQDAKLRIRQLGKLSLLESSPVSISPSIVVQSGVCGLRTLVGVINYGTGNYVGSWYCF